MRNPFRSEVEAFHLLLLTVAAFAAIALASLLGGPWAAAVTLVIVTGAAAFFYLRRGRPERPVRTAPAHVGAADERRILVIANETVGGETLRRMIEQRSRDVRAEVRVVTPALNSPLRHWTSDEDEARGSARERLDASLERLRSLGIQASGEVGDGDPLQAIEDALRTFGADEIIISTHLEGRSNWLERGIVEHARERFAVPITHVIVDLEREREEIPST